MHSLNFTIAWAFSDSRFLFFLFIFGGFWFVSGLVWFGVCFLFWFVFLFCFGFGVLLVFLGFFVLVFVFCITRYCSSRDS